MDKVTRFYVHPDDVSPAETGEYVTIYDYDTVRQQLAAAIAENTDAKAKIQRLQEWNGTLLASNNAAEAERYRAVKDAERYRWLLTNVEEIRHRDWVWWSDDEGCTHVNIRADAAIAAGGEEKGNG